MKNQGGFTWKKALTVGAIIGILLAVILYAWLCVIGNDLNRELNTSEVKIKSIDFSEPLN